MSYIIKQLAGKPDWDSIEPISISQYNWGGDYRPKAEAKLCYVTGEGFFLRISCEEENPKAVYTQANDPVYKDSCLEMFLNFKPQEQGTGYINFEGNANGAILCCYGTSRHNRKKVVELGAEHPAAIPFQSNGLWGYELYVPLSLIQAVYGDASFAKGDMLKGNFFKCGDETENPHYGSWTKIDTPSPDYHLPEFFGTLEIG